jgi:WD40 repeat protein
VEEPQVTMAEGADGATPILPLLEEWATSPSAANRLSVLLGSFGSGKTTTSQLLAQRLLKRRETDPAAPFPVYLDFRRLNDAYGDKNPSSLVELIVGSLAPAYRDRIDVATILPLLRGEPCVIIFDGLDEIGTRIGHERASQIYRQLLEIVPREAWNADSAEGRTTPDWTVCPVRLLVTCRTHFFRSHIEEESTFSARGRQDIRPGTLSRPRIAVWYMAPFTPDQIRSFFVRSLDAEQGAKTFAAIARVGALDDLAAKPIMTRYITEIAPALLEDHAAGRPINAARIYRHLFDSALERDRDKRLLLTPDDRLRLLQSLALKLWRDRKPVIRIDELERWFDAYAIDDPGLKLIAASGREARHLLHLELRNASLLVRGQDDGFRFVHTSFGEYFLACGLLETMLNRAYADLGDMAPVSEETLGFLLDLAEIEGAGERLRSGTHALLCSDEAAARRQFAERLRALINGRFGWHDMPAGANLSDLDCSEGHFVSPAKGERVFSKVRFDRAYLFKARFTDASFDDCSFDGAVLAQAEFDRCRFVACTGAPREFGSVRMHRSDVSGSPGLDFRAVVLRTNGRPRVRPGKSIIPLGHGNTVNAVAFAPDGRTVITGSDDNTARLWDATTGTEIRRFEGHDSPVNAVAFAPDGRTVITGSDDNTARLWDTTTGTEIERFEGHGKSVTAVAFAPDGRTVITGSDDNTARLWDAATGTEIGRFEGHGNWVSAVAFAPDGKTVLTGSADYTARLWNAATGTEIGCFEGHGNWVSAVAFSPDGRTVITGSDDRTARLWDATTGTEIRCFEGHDNPVTAIAFAPDSKNIMTGSYDDTARLWNVATGTEIRRFEGHGNPVNAVAFSPDGSTVITGSDDITARLWDATTGAEIRSFEGDGIPVTAVAFAPDGRTVITAIYDNTARLWDATTGTGFRRFEGHDSQVNAVAFAPDGRTVITGSDDNTARLWDAETGTEIRRFEGHGNPVTVIAFAPDGKTVLSGSHDETRLWDAATGTEIRRDEGHGNWVSAVAFAPDGRTVVTSSGDKIARLWDAATGTEIRRFEGHGESVTAVAFAPDGRTVITGSDDYTARLWDAVTGTEIRRFEGHGNWVSAVAFAPDGSTVLTGSHDKTARLWDAVTGTEIRRFEGHGNSVSAVAFAPDGRTILTGSWDSTARLWDAATGKVLRIMLALPDSWAVLDEDMTVTDIGPNAWRYLYEIGTGPDGKSVVMPPACDDGGEPGADG